ncbi:hypothetical protein FKM82_019367 [Ascaphus truei]
MFVDNPINLATRFIVLRDKQRACFTSILGTITICPRISIHKPFPGTAIPHSGLIQRKQCTPINIQNLLLFGLKDHPIIASFYESVGQFLRLSNKITERGAIPPQLEVLTLGYPCNN